VYVRPFPGPGPKRLVSSKGGTEPRWRADGREIFYRRGQDVVAVDVAPGSALTLSAPHALFSGQYHVPSGNASSWDVMPDGQGFLMIQDFSRPRSAVLLVPDWFEELRR